MQALPSDKVNKVLYLFFFLSGVVKFVHGFFCCGLLVIGRGEKMRKTPQLC